MNRRISIIVMNRDAEDRLAASSLPSQGESDAGREPADPARRDADSGSAGRRA